MGALPQFVRGRRVLATALRGSSTALLVLMAWLCLGARVYADSGQPGAIGRVDGRDVSVEGGTADGASPQSSASIYVTSGSVVTVHSGRAHLTLFTGGDVEICGPAKVTLLESSGAITLALNFGRVRAKLPAKTSLRVFTPTIVATPIDISGGTRDVAVGLSLDDSLCVMATSGALQLEHQFSGEKLIVPQSGEFFLNSGQLVPVAGTPGSCDCDTADSPQQTAPAAPPEYAVVARTPAANAAPAPSLSPAPVPSTADPSPASSAPPAISAPTAPSKPAPRAASSAPVTSAPLAPADASPSFPASTQPQFQPLPVKSEPDFDLQVLAHAAEMHPVSAVERPEDPEQPPVSVPASVTIASPLVFMASAPGAPAAPSPDLILLIREAKVSPDWEFNGHVDSQSFAVAVHNALGEGGASSHPPAAGSAAERPRGFWATLKRIFVGNGTVTD
jgi:hypothetical protein